MAKPGPKTPEGKKRSLAAIKPFSWQKGQSGNPHGRPKGSSLTEILRRMCEAPVSEMPGAKKLAKEYGIEVNKYTTVGEVLDQALILEAIQGKLKGAEMIFERLEGKVTQKIEQEISGKAPISILTERMQEDRD